MIRLPPAPRLGLTLLALIALGGAAQAETVTLSGVVAERFGPKFVLDTGEARVLVETGPAWRRAGTPEVGESVTVTGHERDSGLRATRIVFADGAEVAAPAPPPPGPDHRDPDARDAEARRPGRRGPQTGLDAEAMERLTADLAAARIAAPRVVETGPRHAVVEAVAATGASVRIEVDRHGALRRVESSAGAGLAALLPDWAQEAAADEGVAAVAGIRFTPRHVHVAGEDARGEAVRLRLRREGEARGPRHGGAPDADALRRSVEAAGYGWRGGLAQHRAHAEVDAVNPEGEPVRLRLDRDGEIVRERARR
ncbi:MAG: hypothetical protein EA355_14310 [Rhodobacteraceae bacterium]|nr:MAG: hypothetical protein EA355_14310 [Paracoccaceae bacterium]